MGLEAQARQRLEQELTRLEDQRRELAVERDVPGDRADQAGQLERAEQASFLSRRIAEIRGLLAKPDTSEPGLLPDGTMVRLRFADGSEDELRVIAFTEEAADDEDNVLTADSPLGRALHGHEVGEQVTYQTPRGTASVEILALRLPD